MVDKGSFDSSTKGSVRQRALSIVNCRLYRETGRFSVSLIITYTVRVTASPNRRSINSTATGGEPTKVISKKGPEKNPPPETLWSKKHVSVTVTAAEKLLIPNS